MELKALSSPTRTFLCHDISKATISTRLCTGLHAGPRCGGHFADLQKSEFSFGGLCRLPGDRHPLTIIYPCSHINACDCQQPRQTIMSLGLPLKVLFSGLNLSVVAAVLLVIVARAWCEKRKRETDRRVPMVPYLIPWVGSALDIWSGPDAFFSRAM